MITDHADPLVEVGDLLRERRGRGPLDRLLPVVARERLGALVVATGPVQVEQHAGDPVLLARDQPLGLLERWRVLPRSALPEHLVQASRQAGLVDALPRITEAAVPTQEPPHRAGVGQGWIGRAREDRQQVDELGGVVHAGRVEGAPAPIAPVRRLAALDRGVEREGGIPGGGVDGVEQRRRLDRTHLVGQLDRGRRAVPAVLHEVGPVREGVELVEGRGGVIAEQVGRDEQRHVEVGVVGARVGQGGQEEPFGRHVTLLRRRGSTRPTGRMRRRRRPSAHGSSGRPSSRRTGART